jgi:hypothetical protein
MGAVDELPLSKIGARSGHWSPQLVREGSVMPQGIPEAIDRLSSEGWSASVEGGFRIFRRYDRGYR